MTKLTPVLANQEQRVAAALKLHGDAQTSAAQMALAAVKCGLELIAIKKEVGHGNWDAFFAKHFAGHGLSDRTGRRYMALGSGIKGKVLKSATVADLKLLDSAPSSLSAKEQATLTKVVAKITDGKAMSELYQDYGIAKKPQGSGAKGGDTRRPEAAEGESTAETAAPEPASGGMPINEDPRAWKLNQLLEEALLDGWWHDCTDQFRRTLHGNLLDATAKVAALLKK